MFEKHQSTDNIVTGKELNMITMKLTHLTRIGFGIGLGCLLPAPALQAQTAPLTAGTPILLENTKDGFDFIRVDSAGNRLLLGHEGNKSLDVFDLGSLKLLKVVPTGTAQDAAVDVKGGKYYVSGNDPGRMVIVDSTTLEVTGEVPMPKDTDLIAFNPVTGLVYESNDKGPELWLVDPAAKKIVGTIEYDGSGVEDLAFDEGYKHLYQAIKGKNTVAVVDPASNKILDAWPCAPAKGPHGIAVVPEADGLLAACGGKLVLFNRSSGKQVAMADIAARVDEMAYDPGLHRAYCAGRQGKISTVAVEAGNLTALADVADESGTGSIAVDPKTHTVWIAFHKGDQCFVQPFTPAK
jgi:DNA-binding beta-propeller fold protein YncE